MKWRCDLNHFRTTIKEEMEDIFWVAYLWTWVWVQMLHFAGIAFPAIKAMGNYVRYDWDDKIELYMSDGIADYGNYNFWGAV